MLGITALIASAVTLYSPQYFLAEHDAEASPPRALLLAAVSLPVDGAERSVPDCRHLQPLRHARTARVRGRCPGGAGRQTRGAHRRDAVSVREPVSLTVLFAGRGARVWPMRHRGSAFTRGEGAARTHPVGGAGLDDRRIDRQSRAVPAALLAAARARQRTRARERAALRAGSERRVLHSVAAVVRGVPGADDARGGAGVRCAGRGGDSLGLGQRAVPAASQAAGRLLDGRAARLLVPAFPAGVGARRRFPGLERRADFPRCARLREDSDVSDGGQYPACGRP